MPPAPAKRTRLRYPPGIWSFAPAPVQHLGSHRFWPSFCATVRPPGPLGASHVEQAQPSCMGGVGAAACTLVPQVCPRRRPTQHRQSTPLCSKSACPRSAPAPGAQRGRHVGQRHPLARAATVHRCAGAAAPRPSREEDQRCRGLKSARTSFKGGKGPSRPGRRPQPPEAGACLRSAKVKKEIVGKEQQNTQRSSAISALRAGVTASHQRCATPGHGDTHRSVRGGVVHGTLQQLDVCLVAGARNMRSSKKTARWQRRSSTRSAICASPPSGPAVKRLAPSAWPSGQPCSTPSRSVAGPWCRGTRWRNCDSHQHAIAKSKHGLFAAKSCAITPAVCCHGQWKPGRPAGRRPAPAWDALHLDPVACAGHGGENGLAMDTHCRLRASASGKIEEGSTGVGGGKSRRRAWRPSTHAHHLCHHSFHHHRRARRIAHQRAVPCRHAAATIGIDVGLHGVQPQLQFTDARLAGAQHGTRAPRLRCGGCRRVG